MYCIFDRNEKFIWLENVLCCIYFYGIFSDKIFLTLCMNKRKGK